MLLLLSLFVPKSLSEMSGLVLASLKLFFRLFGCNSCLMTRYL